MAAVCPKCGGSLKPFSIRSRFKCPSCSTNLKGHLAGPLVATIVLWQLADMFLYPLFHLLAGDAWPTIILRSLISVCVGLPLYMLLVTRFAEVDVDHMK